MEESVKLDKWAGFVRKALKNTQQQEFITGISLPSILQFVEMERRTCLMEVFSEFNEKGFFYFHKGVLFDASYDDLEGEAAALEMMSWDNVKINFSPVTENDMSRRINTGLASLILRGADNRGKEKDATDEFESAVLKQEIDKLSSDDIEFEEKDEFSDESDIASELKEDNNYQAITKNEKGVVMDVQRLNEAIEVQKEGLGEGLLATDIYAGVDGQSIAGYNSNPQACALFNKITGDLSDSLTGSGFPGLGKYYMLDLVDNKMVVVIPLGDYQWGMLIDTNKVQLGLLLNVVMPKMLNAFEEAITG